MSPRLIAFALFGVSALAIVMIKTNWEEKPAEAPQPTLERLEPPPAAEAAAVPVPRAPKAEAPRAKADTVANDSPKAALILPRDPSEETERYADPDLVEKRDEEERRVKALQGGLVTQ